MLFLKPPSNLLMKSLSCSWLGSLATLYPPCVELVLLRLRYSCCLWGVKPYEKSLVCNVWLRRLVFGTSGRAIGDSRSLLGRAANGGRRCLCFEEGRVGKWTWSWNIIRYCGTDLRKWSGMVKCPDSARLLCVSNWWSRWAVNKCSLSLGGSVESPPSTEPSRSMDFSNELEVWFILATHYEFLCFKSLETAWLSSDW